MYPTSVSFVSSLQHLYNTVRGLHVFIYFSGGVDYSEVLAQLTSFQFLFESRKRSVSSNEQCINVTIMSDDIVEDDEVFYALLSTDDPLVMLYPNASEITIINNDRESNHLFTLCLYGLFQSI